MIKVESSADVVSAIDALVPILRARGVHQLAERLHHRTHAVAWTSGSEYLGELHRVIQVAFASDELVHVGEGEARVLREIMRVAEPYA